MKRAIAISAPGHLMIERRQLSLKQGRETIASAPLEDLSLLVVDQADTTWTGALLSECGDYGIAIVFCGGKHLPSSLLLPFEGHFLMADTYRRQWETSLPLKKRTWQTIIVYKIRAQARLLSRWVGHDAGLAKLCSLVRSGDPDNVEAQAASRYFQALFGEEFRRERKGVDPNPRLNYGYAVLRAAVARAVVLAGLHPSVGIHHHNRFNAFCLVDDLMEPLRPLVDDQVRQSLDRFPEAEDLTPPLKRFLLEFLSREVEWEVARVSLDHALERYAARARDVLVGDVRDLACPSV